MTSTHVQEVLKREEKAQKDAKKRQDEINRKRVTPMPCGLGNYDARTQKEVEETRRTKMLFPITRLRRSARCKGRDFKVKRDKDGAFRISNRLDGEKAVAELN